MKRKGFFLILLFFVILGVSLFASGIKYGGTLTLTGGAASPSPARIFNPFIPTSLYGVYVTYEPLISINPLNGEETSWLATSYKWEDKNLKLVYQIREGVKWSDGIPLTSRDVVYTFQLMKKYPALDLNGIWSSGLQNVSADGPNTVIFSFDKPNIPVQAYISSTLIVPEHIWSKVKDPVTWTNPTPIGSGPFVFDKFSGSTYTFKRNPNYWQKGKPYVERLKFVIYTTNTTATMALAKGILDWGGYFIPDIEKTYVAHDPENFHYWFPPGSTILLLLNNQKPLFASAKVRLAIAMAINKERISKIGEYGYGAPAHPTALLPSFMDKWFDPTLKPLVYKYDPEKSVEILKNLGFTRGTDGIFVDKGGKKLSATLLTVTGWTDWVTDAQLIAKDLKKIGILINVKSVTYSTYRASLSTGSFDMALMWTVAGPSPYFHYNGRLNSKGSAPIGKTAVSNYERWEDPITDAMLRIIKETSDFTLQKRAMSVIEKIMLTEVPSIPLFYGPTWYEYNTRRFVGWPTKENFYCYPYSRLVILTHVHLK